MTDADLKKYIHDNLTQLKNDRMRFEHDMKEASSFMRHRTKEPHSPVKEIPLYNSTPMDAIKTCIHGMAGYLLSPSIRWFRFITKGEDFQRSDDLYGANDWLDHVMDIMYSLYSNSRFYATTQEALEDAMVTGTSYEMVTDRIGEDGKVLFDCYSPYECYIAENDSGIVDTFFREYTMTARQAYQRFGEDLPEEVKRLVRKDGNPTAECTFIHAVFPRDTYVQGFAAASSKRFASVHYSVMGDAVIRESGYDDFPLAIHRWKKTSNSPYGVSLVMQYLPEIRRLNDLTKQYSIAVQFQASPTLYAPEALRDRFVYRPGYINYGNINAVGKPEIVPNQLNIQYLGAQIADQEAKLQRLLYADLFNILMRQERQRTAYEVQELKGEGLILLSAIIGNMQDEKLTPLVLRTFRIMLRSGLLPQPPQALVKASANGMVTVELDGPLAQTMKAYHQATGLMQGLAAISNAIQVFPDEIVQFDGQEIARQLATAQGLPQNCIREKVDVDKIKQAQAQAQQQKEQQEQALQQSQILKNMGYDIANPSGAAAQPYSLPGGVM